VLKNTLARLKRVQGLAVKLVAVQNRFFGPAVTVAGLLTGCDIAAALEGKRTGDVVIVSADALKEDEQVFLDGMSLDRLGELLKVRVFPARRFQDILALAKREGGRTSS
jgi:NifB/MoaA-like Fe-S oxidoreductase